MSPEQKITFANKESVLQISGGVAFWKIEPAEVVLDIFDFGTFADGVALLTEEIVHLPD